MKKLYKVLALALALIMAIIAISTVSARLGETIEQCDERHGTPFSFYEELYRDYYKGAFHIYIDFIDGVAQGIAYRKAVPVPRELSDNEIQILLTINSADGEEWEQYSDIEWHSSEGKIATYSERFWQLTIETKELIEDRNRKEEVEEKEALEGL